MVVGMSIANSLITIVSRNFLRRPGLTWHNAVAVCNRECRGGFQTAPFLLLKNFIIFSENNNESTALRI
jgi:hypothetical protein